MAAELPRLCVGLLHDYAARDFYDSGVLEELAAHFRLSFVTGPRMTLDLPRFGPVHPYKDSAWWRRIAIELARGLRHMVDKSKFEFNRRHALARATFGCSPKATLLIDWTSRVGLAAPAAFVLRTMMRASAVDSIPDGERPDLLLVYTSVNSYFTDDLVREAGKKRIPLIAVTNNWDNLNTKSFLEMPPYIGVWGEQGFLIARLMHLIQPHRIFVIGAPRFEIYRRAQVSRQAARDNLGLQQDGRVLLFCGAGVAFEESSLIEDLDAAIEDGRLPADIHILYKPHPIRFKRTGEKELDYARLRHVSLVASKRGLTELELYPYLMQAVDGLISPFSTMVMEGAHHGLPALCLAYNDSGHASHDWNRVAYNLHLYAIRHGEWAVVCDNRQGFIDGCRSLIAKLGDGRYAAMARQSAAMVFQHGDKTVAQRIADAAARILKGLDADDSYRASLQGPLAPTGAGAQAPVDDGK